MTTTTRPSTRLDRTLAYLDAALAAAEQAMVDRAIRVRRARVADRDDLLRFADRVDPFDQTPILATDLDSRHRAATLCENPY